MFIRALIVGLVLLALGAPAHGGWYDGAWSNRKSITIDSSQVAASQLDFPVLVSLATDAELAATAQDDADDILFTASDGVTKLDHEIVDFDGTTGELLAWVEVAVLFNAVDTVIYMYYGNASATDQQNVAGTWSNGYEAVLHLQETGNGTDDEYLDSSGNEHHGTGGGLEGAGDSAKTPARVTGKWGYAQSFDDATTDVIRLDAVADGAWTAVTVSLWINADDGVDARLFAKNWSTNAADCVWQLGQETQQLKIRNRTNTNNGTFAGGAAWATGSWIYLVYTWDAATDTVLGYWNASEEINSALVGDDLYDDATPPSIGNNASLDRGYDGRLQEARLSTVARSAAWITTEFNNQDDPASFSTLGDEEGPPFVDVSTTTGFDVTVTSGTEPGSLHWGDLDGDGDLDAIALGDAAKLMISNTAGTTFTASAFGGGNRQRQGALLDVDNDGDLDFWHKDEILYENDGNATFSDEGSLGFADPTNNEGVAAADVNLDGFCDVVMFSENGNWIGHHQGDSPPTFVETTAASYGMNDGGDVGNGDYCSSGDVNNDGYLDFFYHYGTGVLLVSDTDGTYTEPGGGGIAVVTGNSDKMGSAFADYDNDGDLDLFVCRYDDGAQGYLYRNDGTGAFTDVTGAAGLTHNEGQLGCAWGDYDHDGDLDLYLVARETGDPNALYANNGDGTFTLAYENVEVTGASLDASFVDYDNDGDLDLAITRSGAAMVLLQNQLDDTNYLKVRVVGGGQGLTNAAGCGVRVELWDAAGTTFIARRDVGVARSYGGTDSFWVHFGGVNPATTYTVKVYFVSRAQSVQVTPGAASTTIGGNVVPQMVTITEGGGDDSIAVTRWSEQRPE